ncbi:hypothetical protein BBAD15_g9356 [Beauveria bassiana D1-5]|uniref:Uncharacterized protein n=1 Tax=Beauveria bassiana D1-5 TaxID=1245745 RepID=A0A0A2VXB1_BEABA|nr:hypothetical protein BBAD15_g9356 [Beauveria bassiana D1-5]
MKKTTDVELDVLDNAPASSALTLPPPSRTPSTSTYTTGRLKFEEEKQEGFVLRPGNGGGGGNDGGSGSGSGDGDEARAIASGSRCSCMAFSAL